MGNARNTIAYFKQESVIGTAVVPSSATDGFVSVEKPTVTTGEYEVLDNEELSPSIGYKKPQLGFESASASISFNLRSHGDSTSPTAPDFGVLFDSAVGTAHTSTAQTVRATPAPSTTEFGFQTEGAIQLLDLMIVNNTTDKRVARFCRQLKIDVVAGVNDDIDFNEGGAEITATLSAGTYIHGGSLVVGSIGEEIKSKLDAAGTGVVTVSVDLATNGSYKYTISSTAATFSLRQNGTNVATSFTKLNLGFGNTNLTGSQTYTAASFVWGNRAVCHRPMTTAPTAADAIYATVNYKPINDSHLHFTSGFYHGNSASDGYLEQVIGGLVTTLGVAIETGSVAKFNVDIQGLKGDRVAQTAAPFTPSYEAVEGLTAFCVEASLDNTLVDANAFNLSLENEVSEKKSFKECSGKVGSIVRSRKVSGDLNPYADGLTAFYDAIGALTDFRIALIIGKKDANGFILGKTVGIYLPQAMFVSDASGDIDDNMIETLNFQAHSGNTGTLPEISISFA